MISYLMLGTIGIIILVVYCFLVFCIISSIDRKLTRIQQFLVRFDEKQGLKIFEEIDNVFWYGN